MRKFLRKFKLRNIISKGERLIYVVIFLWIIFGIIGLMKNTNLAQLAGYYASLTLFVSTYLWGEWKRTSKATKLFEKGSNSSRELIIYITVFLWCVLGVFGIFYMNELNSLTVYFSSLSPFVISYIIYKTSKGQDLPIFDGRSQQLIDTAIEAVNINDDTNNSKNTTIIVNDKTPKNPSTINNLSTDKSSLEEPLDNKKYTGCIPSNDNENNENV